MSLNPQQLLFEQIITFEVSIIESFLYTVNVLIVV